MTALTLPTKHRSLWHFVPGLALTAALTGAALWAGSFPAIAGAGFSALTLAILFGMVVGNTVYPKIWQPCDGGVIFAKQHLLRLGIILYGFRLTFAQIADVGVSGILIDVLTLSSTFFIACFLGQKVFGLDKHTSWLIGAGSSICGAAAVLATEPVVKAEASKVTVAVATVVIFGTIAIFLYPAMYPLLAHWFFKHCSDSVSQYIFVLAMVFLGAYLAHMAGLEPIIGAFLSGLALNRQIPRTSPLMNRIEFVGNAIFIPFFLIGVGMLIDYRAFFRDWESIEVAMVMIALITLAKFLAAYFTQKTFRLSNDQRTVIFGLSSAHVAATLAAVMVGYNVILGHTADGEPIRLLSESVLNGTILMILATCTISTFATQRGAHNIAIKGVRENDESTEHQDEHILIPVSNEESVRELVTLGNVLKSKKNHNGFYALHAIDNKVEDSGLEKRARKILETAATAAAASDIYLHELLRYDVNISNAIASVAKEQSITDIVMGLHRDKSPAIFLGKITGDLLGESNVTTYIYKPVQPLATIKRHIVIIPSQAEKEAGFLMWLHKIGNLARNTGTKIVVYAPETTLKYIEPLRRKQTATVETVLFKDWEKLPALLRELRTDDCLWLVMSRRERISYQPAMNKIPAYLDQYLGRNSFVLIYPVQAGDPESRYL